MRFAFDEEHTELQHAVAESLQDACPPTRVRAAWDARDTDLRAVLAELGLLGLNLPEDAGGLGLGATHWVLPLEETGKLAVPTPLVETFATNPTLAEAGLTDLAERVASGEAFVTAMQAGGLAVDADIAEAILVVDGGRVSRVNNPVLTPQTSVDGTRRLFAVTGALEDLDADGAALFDRAALAASAQLIGLGQHMLDVAVDYAKSRRQFGKPIGAFQAVQHHLVDALLQLQFARPAVYRAAWSLEHGHKDASLHVSMAKTHASEAATFVARKALQVHGAIGYTFEYDLHMWMKRSWALSSAWGDPKWHIARVGGHVLGDDHV